jgi:hypothetical protein
VTGGDGGFGGRRCARKATRKGGARVSFDAPERGKKKRPKEGARGCLPEPESSKNRSRYGGSGEEIEQPGGSRLRGEGRRKERGCEAL